jgi:molecular chaperone GrpE
LWKTWASRLEIINLITGVYKTIMTPRKHKQDEQETAALTEDMYPAQPEGTLSAEELIPEEEAVTVVDVAALQGERDEARKCAAEYLDGWQRSMAEFANYKKRIDRDREQIQQALSGTIIKRYLEVADDLDRALKNRPQAGDGAAWANGIELIYRKLLAILDSQDVKLMDALGQPFDPTKHEAIGQMESTVYPSGHIAEVIQNGYLIGDRILRPALVRIVS